MTQTRHPVPESPASTEAPLTRAEKEKLLQQMYTLPHWIAVIRLFGYQTLAMNKARDAIKPIAKEFGKEPVANACEVLVEIVSGKEPVARLKSHIKRMAFQILGPEQSPVPSESQSKSRPARARTKPQEPAETPDSPPSKEITAPPETHSPIMEQYSEAKEQHPDMILLFRIGDFYEIFGNDAETCHKVLGLTLTTRDQTHTMSGFPHHQLETYLHKLLKEGLRVAVCDQVDATTKSVRRQITRVVSPGSIVEKPVMQPRHFVLREFEKWMTKQGLAFVAIDDVKKTTPAVAPHVGSLDFIVLRGDEKLLVIVRPHLHAKHLKAIAELQKLFGANYRPTRIWPTDGPNGWTWGEHAVTV